MSDELAVFSLPELKDTVQDMRDLLSQRRIAFLLGAGCSKKAGLPLMSELTKEVLAHGNLDPTTKELLDAVHVLFDGAESATIEDYMSEIVDHLSIAERRTQRGAKQSKISMNEKEWESEQLQTALNEIKRTISSALGDKEVDVSVHQQFIKAIHYHLEAGKDIRYVNYFVLNYDTLIEDALGLEKVPYVDGFAGGATGWWKPSTFQNKEEAVRVFKIHGSIDWCQLEGDSLPRRIRSKINIENNKRHFLIYPAATKYKETQRDPFAQQLDQMRQRLCPGAEKEMVLAICGYNFGDSHIDLEIENALRRSEGRLTIAAFVETDEPEGKLKGWLDVSTISEQIRVYAKKGFFHGDKKLELDDEIPWWRFEILARILGGER